MRITPYENYTRTSLCVDRCAGIIRAEFGFVALGKGVDQFAVEVVVTSRDFRFHALVIHLARAVDVLTQAIVQVVFRAAFSNLLLVVQLDLGYQQPRKPPRVIV